MNHEEIVKEVKMTYYELLDYLLEKYGSAKYDYFTKPECKYKNKKVSRTKEGLYCHHMDEDEGGNLSDPFSAKEQCFEWQKKERLVYCNAIEHLILHIKINILRQKGMLKVPMDISHFFTTGGVFWLTMILNDMYMNGASKVEWMEPCYERIKENYNDYISLMKSYIRYIEQNYEGDKSKPAFLTVGAKVTLKDDEGVIMAISPFGDSFTLKMKSEEEKKISFFEELSVWEQYTYKDYFNYTMRRICSGYTDFHDQIYDDIMKCEKDEYSESFKVDYHSTSLISVKYGFSQCAKICLDKSFGARNADEYILKALSVYPGKKLDFTGKNIKFWKGNVIPEMAKNENCYYFVRFRCKFDIKVGRLPFVKIHGCLYYNARESLTDSMPSKNGKKVGRIECIATGDVYDGQVVMTMAQDDYQKFHECYNTSHEKILDGCYFTPAL